MCYSRDLTMDFNNQGEHNTKLAWIFTSNIYHSALNIIVIEEALLQK